MKYTRVNQYCHENLITEFMLLTFSSLLHTGNSGWAFKEVLPFFKKWENNSDPLIAQDIEYHSVGGPQNVGWFPYQDRNVEPLLDAFQELGYQQVDFNARNQTGVMLAQFFQKDGRVLIRLI